jgi:uncharacterized NAD(P)/FAD-binding protein YdhS
MQSRKLTYVLKAVNRLDVTWQSFVAEIRATEPQPREGRPTVAESQRWQRRIVRWCKIIDRIKAGLDEIRQRICDESEPGAES